MQFPHGGGVAISVAAPPVECAAEGFCAVVSALAYPPKASTSFGQPYFVSNCFMSPYIISNFFSAGANRGGVEAAAAGGGEGPRQEAGRR